MVPVPLDIIENIVDMHNDTKGHQYVQAFSLVCSSVLPLWQQAHIFHGPHRYHGFPTAIIHGRGVRAVSPGIAGYVRHLNITISVPYCKSRYFFGQVSQQLTELQSLTIRPATSQSPMAWNRISPSMKRS